jgi:hypothetical protein
MVNLRLSKTKHGVKDSSVLPKLDNKDNTWKGMTHRYSQNYDKILACIPIDGYKK